MIFSFRIPGVTVTPNVEVHLPATAQCSLPDGRTVRAEIIGHFVNADGTIDVELSTDDPDFGALLSLGIPDWFSSIYVPDES